MGNGKMTAGEVADSVAAIVASHESLRDTLRHRDAEVVALNESCEILKGERDEANDEDREERVALNVTCERLRDEVAQLIGSCDHWQKEAVRVAASRADLKKQWAETEARDRRVAMGVCRELVAANEGTKVRREQVVNLRQQVRDLTDELGNADQAAVDTTVDAAIDANRLRTIKSLRAELADSDRVLHDERKRADVCRATSEQFRKSCAASIERESDLRQQLSARESCSKTDLRQQVRDFSKAAVARGTEAMELEAKCDALREEKRKLALAMTERRTACEVSRKLRATLKRERARTKSLRGQRAFLVGKRGPFVQRSEADRRQFDDKQAECNRLAAQLGYRCDQVKALREQVKCAQADARTNADDALRERYRAIVKAESDKLELLRDRVEHLLRVNRAANDERDVAQADARAAEAERGELVGMGRVTRHDSGPGGDFIGVATKLPKLDLMCQLVELRRVK